ncbi:hypothetical protein J5N97_013741 [Dioscorea zingiberensis]|uniref:Cation efflux protein transmembrane domain-containing protein n=1 Tax=Dioscorea zingiberensis TaxID=325984 RepID=A0A9D5CTJ3_9LILI|nr:hypothetical protein J5N97_013741 [Dioscorea zingiberensis]
MEGQNSQSSQIIEVTVDMPAGVSSLGGRKICGGATCDFSDSKTTLKDSKERSASMRKPMIAVILCIIFMTVEVVGGIKANSLAILTDAAHLLSDVAAFAISLFSLWASGWEATPRQSYGFFRIEILGALVSIQLIWLLTGILVFEAIARMINEGGEVQGFWMFAVSTFGLVVNIIMALLLGHDHGHGGHSHGHSHAGHSHGHDHAGHSHGHSHAGHSHGHDHAGQNHGHADGEHNHGHVHTHGHEKSDENQAHHDDHAAEHGHAVSFSTHRHHSWDDKKKAIHEPLLKHSDSEKSNTDGKEANQQNINVHSAYLHVLGDCVQSIGVMIGGAIIWIKPEWKIIDLICTLVFSVIVLLTTIKMLRNILEVLMESTPREIDATRLEMGLCEMADVGCHS